MTDRILELGHSSYLGDGVYASFDGFQIWLAANHHDNKVIALEPGVFVNLVTYQHRLAEALTALKNSQTPVDTEKEST
jgi:hypothetical protein